MTLVGAVDGATGTVPFVLFQKQEDLRGYLPTLREVISRHDVSAGLYCDQNASPNARLRNPTAWPCGLGTDDAPRSWPEPRRSRTFGLILAHTPQAKGRVGRICDSLYDGLVSKIRLAWAPPNRILRDFLPGNNQRAWNRPSRDQPVASSRRGSPSWTPSASSVGEP